MKCKQNEKGKNFRVSPWWLKNIVGQHPFCFMLRVHGRCCQSRRWRWWVELKESKESVRVLDTEILNHYGMMTMMGNNKNNE